MGYETQCRTGYATVAGDVVTGTNTNFPLRCVGSIFRIGTPGNYPEPLSGMYPYAEQAKIESRTDADSLVLEMPLSGAYADCRYVISDHLDVSPNMFTAVLTGSELWLARLMGKNVDGAAAMFQRDLKMAMEQDVISPISGRRAPYDRTPDSPAAPYAGGGYSMGPDGGT
jgi:hypothetical protein